MNKHFEFILKEPIKFSKGGSFLESGSIELIAPSAKNRNAASKIKKLCSRALISLSSGSDDNAKAKSKGEDKESVTKASDIINALSGADIGNDDLFEELYTLFFRLLENGCGKIEGEKLTSSIMERIDFDDLEKMFGEYIINFLLSSLLTKQDG